MPRSTLNRMAFMPRSLALTLGARCATRVAMPVHILLLRIHHASVGDEWLTAVQARQAQRLLVTMAGASPLRFWLYSVGVAYLNTHAIARRGMLTGLPSRSAMQGGCVAMITAGPATLSKGTTAT